MDINVNIKLDEEALSALNGIAAALAGLQGGTPVAADTSAAVTADKKAAEDKGPFLWANHQTGAFGKAASKAAYDKIKAKDSDVVRVTQTQYDGLVAKADADKKAKAEEAKAEKAAATKAEKTETKAEKPAVPEKAALIEAFTAFLPKDLEAEERTERREFVTAVLQRFGATKVSTLNESHWALAIELVNRKLAGEDVDPTKANFDQFDDAGEDDAGEDDDMI